MKRFALFFSASVAFLFSSSSFALEGRILFPVVTGYDEMKVFSHHPGWVEMFSPGESRGVGAFIGLDGRFSLPDPDGPVILIASFDRLETLPLIQYFPDGPDTVSWDIDIAKHYDYVVLPPGYPEVWDAEYSVRAHAYFQTILPRSRHLYSVTVFDGDKIVWWGNKAHVSIHPDQPYAPAIHMESASGHTPIQTTIHSDREFPRAGFRHGDIVMDPGRKYAVRVSGYMSHGGQNFDLELFVRPDRGDGYGPGRVYADRVAHEGDLCMFIAGSATGQLVENQIRSPEWEILIPRLEPSTDWGQTFVSHGVSMAGLQFWAGSVNENPFECTIQIRKDGPEGEPVGPAKTAIGHKNVTPGSIIRISVSHPGTHPQAVENHIVRPMKEVLRGVTGIREISTNALEGLARISLALLEETDLDATLEQVRTALDTLSGLPAAAEKPVIETFESALDPRAFEMPGGGIPEKYQPIIRYPDWPTMLEGYEEYARPPYDQFSFAWIPDEAPLIPGATYYLEIRSSEPIAVVCDGDYYANGYLYHRGTLAENTPLFHSERCTIAMNLLTFENPKGAPTVIELPVPPLEGDGNLVRNPGAETGEFSGWVIGSDPTIDPGTEIPDPPNRSGNHRFGISVGWNTADMYQYQEIPVETGKRYRAGMWAAHADGTHEVAELLWTDGPFGSEEHLLATTEGSSVNEWHELSSEPFTPTRSPITLIVRYRHPLPSNIASIHVDDIWMREKD